MVRLMHRPNPFDRKDPRGGERPTSFLASTAAVRPPSSVTGRR